MSWFTRLVLKSNQEQEQQIKPTPEFPVKELRATIQRFVDGNGKEDDLDYIVACQKDGSLQALVRFFPLSATLVPIRAAVEGHPEC